jgi:predicted nuclease with RNAse H fold
LGVSKSDDSSGSVCGIDLGASSIWVVRLSGAAYADVVAVERLPASALDRLGEIVSDASVVAIDAPGGFSSGCHLGDSSLAAKFQSARCSEVALRKAGIAVPFVTPLANHDPPSWMQVGFSAWEIANATAASVVETYPHGIFWRLAGRQLFHKQRETGRQLRRAVLRECLDLPVGVELWGHDALDALACAWLAWCVGHGGAEQISCAGDTDWPRHDDSSIWLPAMRTATPTSTGSRPN